MYAFGMTCLGVLGLFLLGLFPDSFFYLMWISPLVILAGVLWLSQLKQPFRRVLEGDFSVLVAMAVASLCCGVLWECWNWLSMPQWRYSIPRVNVMHIFEMPLVGYGGYLPFGVICWLTWQSFSYLFSKRMAVKMRRIETVFSTSRKLRRTENMRNIVKMPNWIWCGMAGLFVLLSGVQVLAAERQVLESGTYPEQSGCTCGLGGAGEHPSCESGCQSDGGTGVSMSVQQGNGPLFLGSHDEG